jgi:rhamnogalacturonan endolyase
MSATVSPLYYNNHPLLTQQTDGAASNLAWTSAKIVETGSNYIDVQFNAAEGEMHWVIFNGLAGAYQYFVNRALPVLGEFRTLWRLDNGTFTSAYMQTRMEFCHHCPSMRLRLRFRMRLGRHLRVDT